MVWRAVEQAISAVTGRPFRIEEMHSLGGGCINEACLISGQDQQYFVKRNRADLLSMFAAESAGLAEMAATDSVRVPSPVCCEASGSDSFLVLEYIEFGSADSGAAERLGQQLAAMHRHSTAQFGWDRDNTIGATPQINTRTDDWASFFAEHRLGYQLALARDNGATNTLIDSGQRLAEQIPAFFSSYRPLPSLLHGDLWDGNQAVDAAGQPVIFDPAVYYGDREADLAMTELFSGFNDRFYHSYRHAWPWDAGYGTRKVLYNLYHVLNHFNLFGAGYARQAQDMIDQLIAEVS